MKRWQQVLIGLGAYLLVVIVMAPASLMDIGLQRMSHGQLRLVEVQGTIWSGSGSIELRDSVGRTGIAKNVAWRMLPASLLRGHLVYEVRMEPDTQPFAASMSISGAEVANADINLPATALSLAVPKLAPFGLDGDLLLHIDHLSFGRKQTLGKFKLQWRNAGSALVTNALLGDYVMDVDVEDSTARVLLRTARGPMQLDGKGSWTRGDKPDFMVTARVPAQYQQQLSPLLRLIALERSAGNFELHSR